jgi:hypothetical protein
MGVFLREYRNGALNKSASNWVYNSGTYTAGSCFNSALTGSTATGAYSSRGWTQYYNGGSYVTGYPGASPAQNVPG